MKNGDNVYIIGSNKLGIHLGYTYNKSDAKEFVAKNPDYDYLKLDMTDELENTLYYDNNLTRSIHNNELLFENEMDDMLTAFEQFTMDSVRHIENFVRDLGYVKFDNYEEKIIVYKLVDFLLGYRNAIKHGMFYEDSMGEDSFFNYKNITDFYIKEILHRKI